MSLQDTPTGRMSEARKRQLRREERRTRRGQPAISPEGPALKSPIDLGRIPSLNFPQAPNALPQLLSAVSAVGQAVGRNTGVGWLAGGAGLVLFILFVLSHVLFGRIFPNVWSLGVYLGDLTTEEAANRLIDAWQRDIQIQLMDGERTWTARPAELGLELDALKTAEGARGVGLAGFPFGYGVTPVVRLNDSKAAAFMAGLVAEVDYEPENAGFAWENEQVVTVPGQDGRRLNIEQTLRLLSASPVLVASARRLDLIVAPVPPDVADSSAHLDQARELMAQPFELRGYDPFTDQTMLWSTSQETFAGWLEAGRDGLTLREDAFAPFVAAQNGTLNVATNPRFLDAEETIGAMRRAIESLQTSALLRIRHEPTTYTVVDGDSGYRIARRIGMPYYLLEQANPGRDLSVLSPGDTVNAPSPDPMIPLTPIAHKRIIVDLNRQYMIAYENGQEVFSWPISSGMEAAPTSPGVFQILSHEELAYGSSYTLCSANGCGQWEMNWFMGIYEAVPGLMNGFHGAVLLPNGAYLGDGAVGQPYTFGCVMARDDDARRLFEWADEGTIVEIISSEFEPRSELGRRALAEIQTRA